MKLNFQNATVIAHMNGCRLNEVGNGEFEVIDRFGTLNEKTGTFNLECAVVSTLKEAVAQIKKFGVKHLEFTDKFHS